MTESSIETNVVETPEVDYKALYEETVQKLETVAAHKDKLYAETKKAKAERETAAKEAQRIADEKAIKDGEFERLWQTTKKEKDELLQKMQELVQSNRREKIQVNAMKIANELADGDNAELLSDFIIKNLDKMADEHGSLNDDVMTAVKEEFKNNNKFRSLLRTTKAVGGGATGNSRSAQEKQSMTRDQFNTLPPHKQYEYVTKVRNGTATLTD